MTRNSFILIIFHLVVSKICAQHIINHSCPVRPVLQNFDLNKYVGRWYEILRYEQFFEIGCDCGFADYTINDDGSVRVRNCCKRLPNTTLSCTIGKAVLSYPDEVPLEGKLSVSFRGEPNESNYWLLDTDYDNYVIVYFCRPKKDDASKSAEAFWLLSKQKTINPDIQTKVDEYLDKYFDRSAMRIAKQDLEM